MADSNITKKALAQALKDLMMEQPFEKISVGDICELCGMNRKSFYYHFKDKYDLVEWIFYTEFIVLMGKTSTEDKWAFMEKICEYFYGAREFYVRALDVKGQNSFRQYFREYFCDAAEPFLLNAARNSLPEERNSEFYVTFFSDAILMAIIRWLTEGAKLPPEQFVEKLRDVSALLLHHVKSEFNVSEL